MSKKKQRKEVVYNEPTLTEIKSYIKEKFGGLGIIVKGSDRIVIVSENKLSEMAVRGILSNTGGFCIVFFTKEFYYQRFGVQP